MSDLRELHKWPLAFREEQLLHLLHSSYATPPAADVCYGSYHFLLGLSDMLNFRLNVEMCNLCIVGEAVNYNTDNVSRVMSSAAQITNFNGPRLEPCGRLHSS